MFLSQTGLKNQTSLKRTGENKSPQVEAIRRAVLEYKNTLEASSSKSAEEALENAKKIVATAHL